jgi:5-hydroxyisourate hydrolase
MPAKLSTHVLDTANGIPAANMQVELHAIDGAARHHITTFHTTTDGRNGDGLLLNEQTLKVGQYELLFHVGDYFRGRGEKPAADAAVLFLDVVPIRFGIPDATVGYHVPLLCSQWSYSTYRGS